MLGRDFEGHNSMFGGLRNMLIGKLLSRSKAVPNGRSSSVGDIQVKVIVGGLGGLSSDPFTFTVNYPKQVVDRGERTDPLGDGYETRFSFQTKDINGTILPRIAMNERFNSQSDPTPNNWPSFVNAGFPFPPLAPGNVWIDKVSMFSSSAQPSPDPTLEIDPPDFTVVQRAFQEWRVGSATHTSPSGVYLLQTDLKRRRGLATNDPVTFITVP